MSRPAARAPRIIGGLLALAAAMVLCAGRSGAQIADADSAAHLRVLEISSEPSGARVYRDSVLLGTTPLSAPLGGGPAARQTIRLKIIGGDPGSWFVPIVADTIIPDSLWQPGAGADTISRRYLLPIAARITSDPSGADVTLGDSLIGQTPLFASVPGPGAAVSLSKDGFQPQTILLGAGTPGIHAVLVPDGTPGAAGTPSPLAGVSGPSPTTLIVAGGAAVVTGAAAAWLKNRADNYYEDYRAGGDPGTLDRVRRYDLLSGIALSVAEISLGYLIIELLSR